MTASAPIRARDLGRDRGRRRLLDQLLVVALDRALALAQVDAVAVRVAQHLELDVPRLDQVLLEVDRAVAEGGLGLGLGDHEAVPEALLVERDAHAAPAAARGRLDDHRVADVAGQRQRLLDVDQHVLRAGNGGQPGGDHELARLGLVAHRADHVGGRADEGEARGDDGLGELRVLGEEAVAGMDGVGVRHLGRGEDARDGAIALRRRRRADAHRLVGEADVQRLAVGLGEDGDGLDLELPAGAQDAQRDLAPIGDEDFLEHCAEIRRWGDFDQDRP